jgi:hypothetical protein
MAFLASNFHDARPFDNGRFLLALGKIRGLGKGLEMILLAMSNLGLARRGALAVERFIAPSS